MKKTATYIMLCLLGGAALAATVPAAQQARNSGEKPSLSKLGKTSVHPGASFGLTSNESGSRIKKSVTPNKTVREENFYYENFSTVTNEPPYALPDGWTTIATPGHQDDVFRAGTVNYGGQILNGPSGINTAFIFSQSYVHDSWMFTPGIEMEAGEEYTIEMVAWNMSTSDVEEKVSVSIGSAANPEAMSSKLGDIKQTDGYWMYELYTFTPDKKGTYYIGYHNTTPANTTGESATLIDYLKVYCGDVPAISIDSSIIDFGDCELGSGTLSHNVTFDNNGMGVLNVSLISASPEITVTGLPAMVDDEWYGTFTVSFTPEKSGPYEGEIKLRTDDPANREITLKVKANVTEPVTVDYIHEDFESMPADREFFKGWIMNPTGTVNSAEFGGCNGSSRCLFGSTYLGDRFVTTPFVNMGANPTLSFYYKAMAGNGMGMNGYAADPDNVRVKVYVCEHGGEWSEVYNISPESDTPHKQNKDFQKVSVDVSKYANKECRLKLELSSVEESFYSPVVFFVDDIIFGSMPSVDVSCARLKGTTWLENEKQGSASVEVRNLGNESISNVKVALIDKAGDREIASSVIESLSPEEMKEIQFNFNLSGADKYELYAKAVVEGDSNDADNVSNCLYIAAVSPEQTTVSIESGDYNKNTSKVPINAYYHKTAGQIIYTANEIKENQCLISSIAFKSNSPYGYMCNDKIEVYVGETDKESFGNEMIPKESMTKVFEGKIFFPKGSNDFVIPFDKPYAYNGGNLVVMGVKDGNDWVNGLSFTGKETIGVNYTVNASSNIDGEPDFNDGTPRNVRPITRINYSKVSTGSIKGNVALSSIRRGDVKINIDGTSLYTTADEEGNYEFPSIAVGDYTLSFESYGYYKLGSQKVVVKDSQPSVLNVSMTALPMHSITGKVTDKATGNPLKGVKVSLDGYYSEEGTTDAEGAYKIPFAFGDCGEEYVLNISSTKFESASRRFELNSNKKYNIQLEPSSLPACNVNVSGDGEKLKIDWEEPEGQLRHDNGIYNECIGYDNADHNMLFGTVFNEPHCIKSVSWYTSNEEGNHSNFIVRIFGLTADGRPDDKNILYTSETVPHVENGWTTHILPNPLEVDGCMIAVSCHGWLAVGTTDANDDYPFKPGMHYYAGAAYYLGMFDMQNYEKKHLMIRATIADSKEKTSNSTSYVVYRLEDKVISDRSKWKMLATTNDKRVTDDSFYSLEDKDYRYAVVAKYGDKEASPVFSEVVTTSGINEIKDNDTPFNATFFDNKLFINSTTDITSVNIVNLQGMAVLNMNRPAYGIDLSGLPSGGYIASVKLADGKVKTVKIVK